MRPEFFTDSLEKKPTSSKNEGLHLFPTQGLNGAHRSPLHMSLMNRLDAPRLATVAFAALLAGDAAYWVLSAAVWPEPATLPQPRQAALGLPPSGGDVAHLLGGATDAAPDAGPADGRFKLRGVISGSRITGAAVISVDGHTRTYRVGDAVSEGWTLSAASGGQATLQGSSGAITLAVPRQHDPELQGASGGVGTAAAGALAPPRRRGPDVVRVNPKN